MHDSKSSLLVMTSFWRVKFTQLDGFARDRSRNIRCETLRFACRATFECCCFTCSRGEARQWVPTRAMNILSFSTHKLLFMEVGVAERMRTPPAHFTRGVQTPLSSPCCELFSHLQSPVFYKSIILLVLFDTVALLSMNRRNQISQVLCRCEYSKSHLGYFPHREGPLPHQNPGGVHSSGRICHCCFCWVLEVTEGGRMDICCAEAIHCDLAWHATCNVTFLIKSHVCLRKSS